MWSTQHTIITDVSKEQIWQLWSDVEHWNKWDHDVKWCKLDGNFEVGTTLTLQPVEGPTSTSVITQCDYLQGFTNIAKLPLSKMNFIHNITEHESGVALTHRVEISGILGFLFAKIIGEKIANELPSAMENLVKLAKQ
ncbi:SRPBCC family protein [Candidatus Chloroploca sp. Khr17]|uniref:SRPBCC family protein n=1 Tax=Candidatus Chloroploca sp. Khr17 TaxID=2496869 RepID=UPI0013EAA8DC|nr:SRPBCC family protein [Candidatus Chloroploca sp. Khr17]